MKDAVTNKIRLLKDIKPNPDWFKSQRSNLLLEISQSGKKAQRAWSLPGFLLPNFAFKPILVSFVLFCLIFGGGTLAVLAAKGSLPGDLLYPVKIAVENTKVKVSSQENKPKLQAEFVGTRVEELSQIIEKTGDPVEKKEKVVKTVNKLQSQIVSTKTHLDKIKEAEPEKVVEAAEIVTEKTIQVEKALIEAKEKLVEEFEEEESKEVVEAIDDALAAISVAKEERERLIQMEVKLIKPEVEIFNEASVSFEKINK